MKFCEKTFPKKLSSHKNIIYYNTSQEGEVMKYELAVFDLDGTVLDTLTDLDNKIGRAHV